MPLQRSLEVLTLKSLSYEETPIVATQPRAGAHLCHALAQIICLPCTGCNARCAGAWTLRMRPSALANAALQKKKKLQVGTVTPPMLAASPQVHHPQKPSQVRDSGSDSAAAAHAPQCPCQGYAEGAVKRGTTFKYLGTSPLPWPFGTGVGMQP